MHIPKNVVKLILILKYSVEDLPPAAGVQTLEPEPAPVVDVLPTDGMFTFL